VRIITFAGLTRVSLESRGELSTVDTVEDSSQHAPYTKIP